MNWVDKFNIARIISARAFQLAVGANPMVKTKKGEDFISVAKRELENEKVPLKPYKK